MMDFVFCLGPLSPSLSAVLPPIELSIQEQQELGYMPLRDDFERVCTLLCYMFPITSSGALCYCFKLVIKPFTF